MSRERLVGDRIVGACLGHSDHEMIEVLILAKVRRGASRTVTFQTADIDLFGSLVWKVAWEAVRKSKSPGRLCIPLKGTLKGAGASCPRVLKDEPWAKRNSLAKERAMTRTEGGKNSVYHIWKKGQAALDDYRDVLMLHRKKIKKGQIPPRAYPAHCCKRQKRYFYEKISMKRKAKENLPPY